jgi:dienelactone hydrolase
VFLHGNLGLDEATKTILPEVLTQAGYATLVVDSFTTRPGGSGGISPLDAYGALIYLSHSSDLDATRIAVVGNSGGGDAALSIAQPGPQEAFYNPEHLQFRAAVAFTPRCQSDAAFSIPTLVLAAELDQRAPPSGCTRVVEQHAADTKHPSIVVYPNVHNGFQIPEFSPGRVVQEYFREYNAEAAAQATEQMKAFLRDALER